MGADRRQLGALLFSLLASVAACGSRLEPALPVASAVATPSALSTPPAQSSTPAARATATTPFSVRTEVVATGLVVPWALAFATRLPAGDQPPPAGPYLFVTERPGRLRLIAADRLLPQPVVTLPVATVDEAGLLGLALDRAFDQNGYLYVYYTYQGKAGPRNRISRLTLRGLNAGSEKVLLDDIPAGTLHDGGRLAIGPDGKLYATVGTLQAELAQRVDFLGGKILRLNIDGSIPADNPFQNSPVYSYGHRNPQGLAWQPGTGRLFSTEHGPSAGVDGARCCHDEVNVIVPGGNYGWPVVLGVARDPRFVDPVYESGNDTWAPAGSAFYGGSLLAPWRGNFFFGALRGRHLRRVVFGGPKLDQPIQEERLLDGSFGRIRDVAVGPEGALYFTTSNRDMRWTPAPDDDRVVRVVPGR